MVFNWFRRQFNEKTEEAVTPPEAPPAPEEQSEASQDSTSESAVAEDYLAWAKAAYKNIQVRQGQGVEESPETAPTPEAEPTPEPLPDVSAVVSASSAATELEVLPETVAATEAVSPPPEPLVTPEVPETVAPPEVSTSPEPEPEPAIPFWAKAEAERLDRLKRLEETAVEAPPVEELSSGATDLVAGPLAFDEGFLWSAEVLAAQGRRPEEISVEEITWLKKLRLGLDKTRRGLINQLKAIVGAGPLNREAVMRIEDVLLQADVGVEATDRIIEALQSKLREEALPPKEAIAYLKKILRDILDKPTLDDEQPILVPDKDKLNIWLITGVNGSGKTTTIGKLAHIAQKSGYSCTIAAADTFRAAAVEQVKVWGERTGVEVIANPVKNADPAAVVFDAIGRVQAKGTQLLLVDTAGRLQNKKNLMDELHKIRRIIDKKAPDAVVESLIVLDSTLGQNGLHQAQVFSEAVNLSGVILTKLDGTAKGGIAIAVVQQLGLPIRFIGAGEGIEDLRPFSSYEFVEALLNG
ncbi:signal recognition particle-docking protein FtsY [[Phormidium] sp. ETS-05]|uniref:signal recognition particle-docking protein FtsY n=1 Tax=[Phormidium] sp. ETS-05 TaxID=222819 RepID=UPI0018EEFE2D|nr:signal recognition particle-docking protein FtsY [[Phormidium] sp. ETS-05]